MLATSAAVLPSDRDWTYEVKWDGYRTLAVRSGSSVRLLSRNLKDLTAAYPSIVSGLAGVGISDFIVDGEVVAVGSDDGRPSFQALQHHRMAGVTIAYYAFDILRLGKTSLVGLTLTERRRHLHTLLANAGSPILVSHPLPGTPEQIEREIRKLRLEGVVAKRAGSIYRPGQRSDAWVKVKFSPRQEFVVGGYKPNAASFDSLLVGYYRGRSLYFAGKLRAGFTPHVRAELFSRLVPKPARSCPFVNLPNSTGKSRWGEGITEADMPALRWLKPATVIDVEFVEWTDDGLLRHARFVALREDKRPADVRRET
jgi:bifunctional non-homologous end joining protein LigD